MQSCSVCRFRSGRQFGTRRQGYAVDANENPASFAFDGNDSVALIATKIIHSPFLVSLTLNCKQNLIQWLNDDWIECLSQGHTTYKTSLLSMLLAMSLPLSACKVDAHLVARVSSPIRIEVQYGKDRAVDVDTDRPVEHTKDIGWLRSGRQSRICNRAIGNDCPDTKWNCH